jgi:hypothetical protein
LLSFTSCSSSLGTNIYIFAVNLSRVVTPVSFNFVYSLTDANEMIGLSNVNSENFIPLRIFLCKYREARDPLELTGTVFDCDEGCVEYLVCFFFNVFFFIYIFYI